MKPVRYKGRRRGEGRRSERMGFLQKKQTPQAAKFRM
jgi:hypothetical protein